MTKLLGWNILECTYYWVYQWCLQYEHWSAVCCCVKYLRHYIYLLWNYLNGNNLKLKQCMWGICVLLILISQPVMSFKFVGCVVYSYRSSNGLSINAGQVLHIILEWAWRRIANSDNLIPEIYSTQMPLTFCCAK